MYINADIVLRLLTGTKLPFYCDWQFNEPTCDTGMTFFLFNL
jgi:hypothetical protein